MKLKKFHKQYVSWSKGVHAEKTTKTVDLALRKLLNYTGNVHIEKIDIQTADSFVSSLSTSGLKATSVNGYLRNCKSSFNKAVTWGLLNENPFIGIKPLRQQKSPPKFIPKDEVRSFLDGIKDKDKQALITAYLVTGRRRGELLSLEWKDIDIENRMYRVKCSKNHTEKDFPINDAFLSVLESLDKTDGRVFPRWEHPDSVTHLVKRQLEIAGFEDLHLHNLRHTYASAYLMSGGDIRPLKDLLGHSSITTTMIYSHLTPGHLSDENNRISY